MTDGIFPKVLESPEMLCELSLSVTEATGGGLKGFQVGLKGFQVARVTVEIKSRGGSVKYQTCLIFC